MIYVVAGQPIPFSFESATGLAGTAGVQILNEIGTIKVPRTTANITEAPPGSGSYIGTITAPEPGMYVLVIDDGSVTPSHITSLVFQSLSDPSLAPSVLPEPPPGDGLFSIVLNFILPDDPTFTGIRVYEASSEDGPWALIDTTTEIGTYPDYISTYTTHNAVSAYDWFAIRTIDANNVETGLSPPQRVYSTSLPDIITQRVIDRGCTAPENVIRQEAEAVIEQYFKANPYSVDPSTVSYKIMSGLTYMTMARVMIVEIVTTSTEGGWTAGLVSLKGGSTTTSQKTLDWLLEEAYKLLGISMSVIAQMVTPACYGTSLSKLINYDISRLQITVGVE